MSNALAFFTDEEKLSFQKICRDRWQCVLDDLRWSLGPMPTWKPVMTDQQKKEHDQYVEKHQLPF